MTRAVVFPPGPNRVLILTQAEAESLEDLADLGLRLGARHEPKALGTLHTQAAGRRALMLLRELRRERTVKQAAYMSPAMMTRDQVMVRLGLSRAAFYESIRNGLIPPPYRVSSLRRVWFKDHVEEIATAMARGAGTDELRRLTDSIVERLNSAGHELAPLKSAKR